MPELTPFPLQDRARILDILRGIALLGIIIANYPVHSQWVMGGDTVQDAAPFPRLDEVLELIHFTFIDGKFYSLFSLLFGIGFSIILIRCQNTGRNGLAIFYRRLFLLMLFGLLHACIWIGDILLLYALIGMILPLFRNVSDKALLITAVCLIFSPLLFDAFKIATHHRWDPAQALNMKAMMTGDEYGVTQASFPHWLSDHSDFKSILHFNHAGFYMRWSGLFESNRIPKVLATFLLGLWAGRKMIYAKLEEYRPLLTKLRKYGLLFGIPLSFGHALTELLLPKDDSYLTLLNTLGYAISVIPLSLGYTAALCLWYMKNSESKLLNAFSAPGRMALTNYLMHSVAAALIFYGLGLGLPSTIGLANIMLIAISVYIVLLVLSTLWLRYFKYGPLEWLWRMGTYGKWLGLRKTT